MSLKLRFRVKTADARGRILQDTGPRPSRSLVGGMLKMLDTFLIASEDLTGVTPPILPPGVIYNYGTTVPGSSGSLDDALYADGDLKDHLTGIVVGSEDTPEDMENDTSLSSIYSYADMWPHKHHLVDHETNDDDILIITRALTNISGGSLPVKEIGIQLYDRCTLWYNLIIGYQPYYPYLPIMEYHTQAQDWWGLAARDVLPLTHDVPAGGFISIQYEITAPK